MEKDLKWALQCMLCRMKLISYDANSIMREYFDDIIDTEVSKLVDEIRMDTNNLLLKLRSVLNAS